MEWSKLKNIIILLLVAVNLFLLLLTGGHRQQRRSTQEDLRQGSLSFVTTKGIALEEAVLPKTATPAVQTTERDPAQEARLAARALGEAESTGDTTMREYLGKRGSMRFYADGRFFLSLNEEAEEEGHEVERHAISYLKSLGISAVLLDTQTEGQGQLVRVLQQLDGAPIFSCRIDLRYQDGLLRTVQGWHLMGDPKVDQSAKEPFDAPTLLLRFVEGLRQEGKSIQKINAITVGYGYSTASLSAKSDLIPLWRIETELETFYLNCMTGGLETSTLWIH